MVWWSKRKKKRKKKSLIQYLPKSPFPKDMIDWLEGNVKSVYDQTIKDILRVAGGGAFNPAKEWNKIMIEMPDVKHPKRPGGKLPKPPAKKPKKPGKSPYEPGDDSDYADHGVYEDYMGDDMDVDDTYTKSYLDDESFPKKVAMDHVAKKMVSKPYKSTYKTADFSQAQVNSIMKIATAAQKSRQSNSQFNQTFFQVSSKINESNGFTLNSEFLDQPADLSGYWSTYNWKQWALPFGASADNEVAQLQDTSIDVTTAEEIQLKVARSSHSYQLKNNWTAPCQLEIFYMVAKRDGGDTEKPDAIFLADGDHWYEALSVGGGPDKAVELFTFDPNKFVRFREYWNVYRQEKYRVNPGESVWCKIANEDFIYTPQIYDINSNITILRGITKCIFVKMSGALGHGVTTDTEVGISGSKLDVKQMKYSKVYAPQLRSEQSFMLENGTYAAMTGGVEFDFEDQHGAQQVGPSD